MTLQERRAKTLAVKQQAQTKKRMQAFWVIPALLAVVALCVMMPTINSVLDNFQHPPLRSDVVHVALLGNSASDVCMRPKSEVLAQADVINTLLPQRLSSVRTHLMHFASRPVDLYNGFTDPVILHKVIENDYVKVKTDPEPGTYLAKALKAGIDPLPHSSVVVLSIATDSWEDAPEVTKLLKEYKQQGRRIIALIYSVPVHKVDVATIQLDLRGEIRDCMQGLGSNLYIASGKAGSGEFNDAVDRWLVERLRAEKIQLN